MFSLSKQPSKLIRKSIHFHRNISETMYNMSSKKKYKWSVNTKNCSVFLVNQRIQSLKNSVQHVSK